MSIRVQSIVLAACMATVVATSADAWQATHNGAGTGAPPRSAASSLTAPQAITGTVANPELELVPIAPCRAFDTHVSAPLAAAQTFVISGSGNMKGQGGPKAGCGVPLSATAVAISLTASSESGSGSVAAYPSGTPATSTAAVSFNTAGPQTAGVTVAIKSHQLTLKPAGGSAQVSGDITGYYAPQMSAVIEASGTVYESTGRLLSVNNYQTGGYRVEFDRDISRCSVITGMDGGEYYVSAYPEGDTAIVETWGLDSTGGVDVQNLWFNIAVHC